MKLTCAKLNNNKT